MDQSGDTQFHTWQALVSLREGREPLLPLVGHAVSQGQLLAQHYHKWSELFRANIGIQPAAKGFC